MHYINQHPVSALTGCDLYLILFKSLCSYLSLYFCLPSFFWQDLNKGSRSLAAIPQNIPSIVLSSQSVVCNLCLCFFFLFLQGTGKFDEPCAGLDCSRGCKCNPEKGSRVSQCFWQRIIVCTYRRSRRPERLVSCWLRGQQTTTSLGNDDLGAHTFTPTDITMWRIRRPTKTHQCL